jgi:hypothetical protein
MLGHKFGEFFKTRAEFAFKKKERNNNKNMNNNWNLNILERNMVELQYKCYKFRK